MFWDLAIAFPLNLVPEDCGLFWALTWRKGLGLRERCEKSPQLSVESWGESRQEKRGVQDICKHAVVHTGNDKGDLSPGKDLRWKPWRLLSTGMG